MGEDPLSRVLSDAAKLKGAQSSSRRKRFESWPMLLQHTAFMGHEQENKPPLFVTEDSFDNLRALPYAQRLVAALKLKAEATDLYAKGEYFLAMTRYSQAAGLFYYARILNKNWRAEGLNDDYLVLVSDLGKSEEDKARIKEFRVQCYSNITMCLIKLGDEMLSEACRTCDFILQLDSTNVKALFRKAKCLVEPMSCGDAEVDEAIEHLNKALEIDPHNREVAALLRRLRTERSMTRNEEKKAYSGWCTRGPLTSVDVANTSSSQAQDSEMDKLRNDVESRLKDAHLLRDIHRSRGEEDEATNMDVYINELRDKHQAFIESSAPREPLQLLETGQPDDALCKDVMDRFGLDLKDPIVLVELKRLLASLRKNDASSSTTVELALAASQCADSITTKADQRREQAWHEELERLKAENEHATREKHPWLSRLANMSKAEHLAMGIFFMLAMHFKLPNLILVQLPQTITRSVIEVLYEWFANIRGLFRADVDDTIEWLHGP